MKVSNKSKNPSSPHASPHASTSFGGASRRTASKRGIALISVLTIVTLATILVLTFFTLARNEMVASANYSDGLHAKHLSETAVNMVIGQIRKATVDGNKVWASQPGAIRTYSNKTGQFRDGYKLYSSGKMVETSSEVSMANDDFDNLNKWSDKLWKYADLNEPVIRGDRIYYPIVDPRSRDFPIWDSPREFDDAGVEGFDWNMSGVAPSPMKDALTERGERALPMPVEWIYQLEDGTLGHLNESKRFEAFGGGGMATKDNPIIGRVAFWSDDETAKSNVNTHAGGTAWDTPRAGGDIDRNLGRFQPAQREWQRYKGHPATTSLAPVLFPGMKNITLNRDEMEKIFRLVPRVVGGGSESGTRAVNPANDKEANGLIPDKDRLYPSLDDFILQPGGGRGYDHVDPDISYGTRDESIFPRRSGNQGVDEMLEQNRFFLTVSSRAPETNVFNMPRVSVWPTYYAQGDDELKFNHTPFDRVIRFCAELGQTMGLPNQYHFQRRNEDSATADYEDIPRNKMLYAYLDRLTSQEVPGYGGSFEQKFGKANKRQLLTQMFDYIRSTNLFDDTVYDNAIPGNPESWRAAYKQENRNDHLTFTNFRTKSERGLHMGHGQVTPIRIDYDGTSTKGFGRFYTVEEVGLQLICNADGRGPASGPLSVHNIGPVVGPVEDTVGVNLPFYSNFPPLEHTVNPAQDKKHTWPGWIIELDKVDPELAKKALDPYYWNWQLAKANGIYSFDRKDIPDSGALRLQSNERLIQVVFLMEMYCPSAGWTSIQPDMVIDVEFNDLKFQGVTDGVSFEDPLGFSNEYDNGLSSNGILWVGNRHNFSAVWGGRNYGGGGGVRSLMRAAVGPSATEGDLAAQHGIYNYGGGLATHDDYHDGWRAGRRAWFDGRAQDGQIDATNVYPFVTVPFRVDTSGGDLSISGGNPVTINIYANRVVNPSADKAGSAAANRFTSQPKSPPQLVQELEVDFGEFKGRMPLPTLAGGSRELLNEFKKIYNGEASPMEWWSAGFDGANPRSAAGGRLAESSRSPGGRGRFIVQGDTVWSMSVIHGDGRMIAGVSKIPHASSTVKFEPHPLAEKQNRFGHSFTLAQGGTHLTGTSGAVITDLTYPRHKRPLPIPGGEEARDQYQLYGDFDNGMGGTIDGAYINKVDEGNTHSLRKRTVNQVAGSWEWRRDYGSYPYFVREWTHEAAGPAFFSPNRMMPSPVMFGSMPNMVLNNSSVPNEGAWQTLLFRPNVRGEMYETHPGATSPPDHMLLDLFWMPVVEPYAISDPSSTAGRVNMNYQILPFKNITRTSALRGVFQSEYMLCIPNLHVRNYKVGVGRGRGYHWLYSPFDGELQRLSLRSVIVEDEVLEQFEDRFDDDKLFLTASEICDIHLIPQDIGERQGFSNRTGTYKPSVTDMKNGKYWSDHQVVGDNAREAPYAHIYPRLTTKSNTYKVHVRGQMVKKSRDTEPNVWDPERDTVIAEYRGSAIVERYVEANDPSIPDYAFSIDAPALDQYYKFRVINEKRFSP